ncbi:peptide ABC transporter permease [Salipiger aestuarii]|uniref:Peptide/nickel transport system permease protein n=1 Tax=Salipiger aestuarii TaxID=568098 RepID=A0A327XX83_9RHOB|nr:ABC transporter permease [Salipiger aestuarii]EIE49983.1 oligopeptide ABC transporter permease protein [Citreicella sp. 357]KAA8605614.1 peptide ABC transporter permease [Salipiger aestuarii]KAA8608239.1 peptide ABC transporter permease [Salipiger aestuarii]KAB2539816.1 peptide ABC transporter permease [Salipiger aestuarii]RAK11995.1 peptide/nickel transport system permease protein [Salipiger aestuarii]
MTLVDNARRGRRSIFARRPFFTLALVVAVGYVLAAIFAPFVAPYDPVAQDFNAMMQPPSGAHPMGTDSYGQDILSRVIFGARYALIIGFFAVAIGAIGGLIVGLAAGLSGGWAEWALLRLIDSILALPSLILAVAFIAILGQGVDKVVIAVGLSMIGPFARTVRADVLQVRVQLFVEAAGLMAIPRAVIIWRHILPNVIYPLAVQVTIRISEAILVSSSLSFLGIGVTPPTPDWGLMIAEGRAFVSFAAWMSAMPGFALALLLIALSIVGDGIREEFDPKLRGKS